MRIVIDGRMYGPRRWTGIGRYLQRLVAELEELDSDNEYVVLVGRENWDDYHPKRKNFRKILTTPLPYSLGEQVGLVVQLARLRPDVVHFVAPNAPLFYPLSPFGRARRVTTVHDLTLLMYSTARGSGVSKWLREAKKWPFQLVLWWGVRRSARILTPTNYVKQQLVKRYGVTPGRVVVTPEAMDETADGAAAKLERPREYVLYVGNVYPYKNADRLVEAFAAVVAAGRPDLKLVMVGRDDYFRDKLRAKVAGMALEGRVVFTGAVGDADLDAWYAGARLYVNPSRSEGFGLQGLEAMMRGVPVLAARASCLPEVYGEAAEYFDPDDTDGLVRAMTDLLTNEARRVELARRGRARAREFSWRAMAEATLAAYRAAGR